ncbi:hypothetical protein LCGC14_0485900 [marine sediment metagenome]|uniref:Endonuclease GajA/Old nuclease/RecF-like AAA domain-containing protein n=1 Tax=marine sediment metagenome TaxID=412755 RepID=A0A0F9VGV2_9ZZZZ
MKILKLEAENFKRLSVVEITPQGNLIPITGKNASGKSSVLDCIYAAFAGKGAVPGKPIRDGEASATIRLDCGDLIITRRFTERDSYLSVASAEGAEYKSPQKMLDALLGAFTFDPLTFSRQSAVAQFKALSDLVGLDFQQLEEANIVDYDERTALNRNAKSARASAENIQVSDNIPEDIVDTSLLVNELAEAGECNANIEREKEKRTSRTRMIDAMLEEATALKAKHKAAIKEINRLEVEAKQDKPLAEPIAITDLRQRIEVAGATNEAIILRDEARARKKEYATKAKKAEAESNMLTKHIEARKEQIAKAIASAKLPIEGLSLDDGQVFLNGIPFDQCSSAEVLRASVAIAMSANPQLRVIRIEEGSLLDNDGFELIAEMAKAEDYQVWIERVSDNGNVGIVMEDGHVKADNQEPAPHNLSEEQEGPLEGQEPQLFIVEDE